MTVKKLKERSDVVLMFWNPLARIKLTVVINSDLKVNSSALLNARGHHRQVHFAEIQHGSGSEFAEVDCWDCCCETAGTACVFAGTSLILFFTGALTTGLDLISGFGLTTWSPSQVAKEAMSAP
jgi:hypothetical protein